MKTIWGPQLCLIIKFMKSAEAFGICTQTLASKGPYENVEPNNGVRGQLMKKDFIIIQNFSNHLVQRKP